MSRQSAAGWTQPSPRRRPDGRTVVHNVTAHLRATRWLRAHVFAIALLTLGTLALAGMLLKAAGIGHLGLRWAVALPLAYGVYLLLLRLWAQLLLRGDAVELPDPGDLADLVTTPVRRGADAPPITSGGGGDFGGGGAGGSFDLPDACEAPSAAVEGAGSLLDGADEAVVIAVPLAVLLGVALLLAGLFGTGVLMIFGVDVLLAVVGELLLASLAGALAYKGAREGWLGAALARTWRGAFAAWVLAAALGTALGHWLPQATSLPHAARIMVPAR